ncbi:cobyrinate a,c-diamide synthase [Tenacibaculum sp. M341]|uniref:cobyrinate a,c-diamide synthase n=1 Tax=Tenacibaculum sp. M341 TaxID=2530339 RepID=UPI001052A4DB|nr:cobyrinate a,c-diamide synthase [Tenacibaculum sp. M341]TCI93738.1 cobyrinate a,c-diamide synthase [Tenacibaculum sp. M341]
MKKSFLIAAPWSNSGKTTITLGLLRLLKNKGLRVQPFKCGPDYIDTIHHSSAAGISSVNLDSVMMSDEHLTDVFAKYSNKVDISIIEGVMGLFDGAVKDKGSSSEIAKKLNIPVILVVNAKSMAFTVAPILKGLKDFDSNVHIAGVIFNFVRTESHYAFLKEACESIGLTSFGYIPPNDEISIPSRHLGLHIDTSFEDVIENAAAHINKHISVENMLTKIATIQVQKRNLTTPKTSENIKIAVAKDEAFTFTYLENLDYFKQLGEVVYFSPIHDTEVPKADFIYLAGGYPELYLEQLSNNKTMLKAIKSAAENGVKILAECGGMMYLGKSIIDEKGTEFSMVNVFDFNTSMERKKLSLGYRRVVLNNQEIWGHEFHYSNILNDETTTNVASIFSARNKEVNTKIYQYKNVLASYIHFYWGGNGFDPILK